MIVVPAVTPETNPVTESTLAIVVLLLVHIPPGTALNRGVGTVEQKVEGPVMMLGTGLT